MAAGRAEGEVDGVVGEESREDDGDQTSRTDHPVVQDLPAVAPGSMSAVSLLSVVLLGLLVARMVLAVSKHQLQLPGK